MKKIKDLTVKMTFRVGLGDIEVSDSIFNGLDKIANQGDISDDDIGIIRDKEIIEAFEWLGSNINSGDAYCWEYDIEDFIDENLDKEERK